MFSGALPKQLELAPIDRMRDRVMLCGSPALLGDFAAYFKAGQWAEGSSSNLGQYVIEKAFVEK
jgi:ferredoxin--NADP+ reductase